jgi:hypothetical protein
VISKHLNRIVPFTKSAWAAHIEKLNRLDKVPLELIEQTIVRIDDNFGKEYFPEIHSAKSLREKWQKLEAFTRRESNRDQDDNDDQPPVIGNVF